ncbi:hypothetical protein IJJ27_04360 [bacterium]|nr:hypothetical protein [bacterium]
MSKKFVPTKVTPEVFTEVKQTIDNCCLADTAICELFNIGRTTLGYIKKSNSYCDYVKILARKKSLRNLAHKRQEEQIKNLQKYMGLGSCTLVFEKPKRKDKELLWICLALSVGIFLGYFLLVFVQKGGLK